MFQKFRETHNIILYFQNASAFPTIIIYMYYIIYNNITPRWPVVFVRRTVTVFKYFLLSLFFTNITLVLPTQNRLFLIFKTKMLFLPEYAFYENKIYYISILGIIVKQKNGRTFPQNAKRIIAILCARAGTRIL